MSFSNSCGHVAQLGFAMGGQLKKGAQPPSTQPVVGRAGHFVMVRARVRGAWRVARRVAGRVGRGGEGRGASFLRGRQPGWEWVSFIRVAGCGWVELVLPKKYNRHNCAQLHHLQILYVSSPQPSLAPARVMFIARCKFTPGFKRRAVHAPLFPTPRLALPSPCCEKAPFLL